MMQHSLLAKHNRKLDKRLHSALQVKGNLVLTMNYGCIILLYLLRFIMPCFSIVSNQKSRKFIRKIETVFGEIARHNDAL